MPKVEAWMAKKAGTTNCTLENAAIRREWCVVHLTSLRDASLLDRRVIRETSAGDNGRLRVGADTISNRSDLSVPEREEYIKAVLCLQSKPAKAPKAQVPGAVSRYDDFVASHMMQAMILHDTVRTTFGLIRSRRWMLMLFRRRTCLPATGTSSGLLRMP